MVLRDCLGEAECGAEVEADLQLLGAPALRGVGHETLADEVDARRGVPARCHLRVRFGVRLGFGV